MVIAFTVLFAKLAPEKPNIICAAGLIAKRASNPDGFSRIYDKVLASRAVGAEKFASQEDLVE